MWSLLTVVPTDSLRAIGSNKEQLSDKNNEVRERVYDINCDEIWRRRRVVKRRICVCLCVVA